MASESPSVPEWQTVAEVAASERVSPRTLYNWIRSKAVASKVESGVTLLRVLDVRAKLTSRSRSATPASTAAANGRAAAGLPAGTSAGGTGNGGTPGKATSALDGETEARVFALVEQGLDPVAIVRQEQLPSSVVLEALRQHRALRDQQIPSGPTIQERLTSVEEKLDQHLPETQRWREQFEQELKGMVRTVASDVNDFVFPAQGGLSKRIGALEQKLEETIRAYNDWITQLSERVRGLEIWCYHRR